MLRRLPIALLLFAALAFGCAHSGVAPAPAPVSGPEAAAAPPLIVVSFDGFRWDYLDLYPTPNLRRLAREGVHAERLLPSFPTKTFPNHYTLVTGLYPEHHGIVSNTMGDERFQALFSLSIREEVSAGRWWEGEPIWVTAERQGRIATVFFWPGSEAEIQGIRPTFWMPYDPEADDVERLEQALSWLDRPEGERPDLILIYFDEPDGAGHRSGPLSDETREQVVRVDGLAARLRAGLEARGLFDAVDLLVVSDHGMAEVAPERAIVLEEYLDLDEVRVLDPSTMALLWPAPGQLDATLAALAGAHPHLHVARREEMPERLHYRDHPRIAPLVAWADPGWLIYTTHAERERRQQSVTRGNHGYDPAAPEMHAILIGHGPSFRRDFTLPAVENVDLYELLCALLGLEPAPNDGDLARIAPLLTPEATARAASRDDRAP